MNECRITPSAHPTYALPAHLRDLCEGKTVRIILEDGGSEARIVCRNGCFYPDWRAASEADVTFRGELHSYLKLLTRQEDPDTLFFNRQIAIEGDTELGLGIKNLLDALDWPPPFLEKLNALFQPRPRQDTNRANVENEPRNA